MNITGYLTGKWRMEDTLDIRHKLMAIPNQKRLKDMVISNHIETRYGPPSRARYNLKKFLIENNLDIEDDSEVIASIMGWDVDLKRVEQMHEYRVQRNGYSQLSETAHTNHLKRVAMMLAERVNKVGGWWKSQYYHSPVNCSVRFIESDKQPSVRWGRNWPSRGGLCIEIPEGMTLNFYVKDKGDRINKNIRIGDWVWRKPDRTKGLMIRYIGKPENAAKIFTKIENQEMRRAMFTACGEGIMNTVSTYLVHEDESGKLYDIASAQLPESSTKNLHFYGDSDITTTWFGNSRSRVNKKGEILERFVRVVCPSTGTAYWLSVNDNINTAKQAVASTFGMTVENYQPSKQG